MSGQFLASILGLGFFSLLFGMRYLYNKEKMAMIQNGMTPQMLNSSVSTPQPYKILKWALLLMGAGIGLFVAYLLDSLVFIDAGDANVSLYFSMIGFFGGLGLFISYLIEKRELLDKQ